MTIHESALKFDNVDVNRFFHAEVLAYAGFPLQASKLFELAYKEEKSELKKMPDYLRIIDNMRLGIKVRVALANEEFEKAFRTFKRIPEEYFYTDPQLLREVAETKCYRALEQGVENNTGRKKFIEGLYLYDLYGRVGGSSSKKEEALALFLDENRQNGRSGRNH